MVGEKSAFGPVRADAALTQWMSPVILGDDDETNWPGSGGGSPARTDVIQRERATRSAGRESRIYSGGAGALH